MRVRSVLLAVALSCGLMTVAEAKTKKIVVTSKAAANARRNAKKQMKARRNVKVRKPAKHAVVKH